MRTCCKPSNLDPVWRGFVTSPPATMRAARAKPVVARSRREPGGRNSDVNAPPCKGQKHDGSLLPVRTGIAWLALASYATSSTEASWCCCCAAVHAVNAC